MKIAFQTNNISVRGVEVALYDYANFNEHLLGNESIILAKTKGDAVAVDRMEDRFEVFYYNNWNNAEKIMDENKVDILYSIKMGAIDEVVSKCRKTVVHSVFSFFEPHGDVYAYVSEWMSKKMTNNKYPYVPHMVHLPDINDDLRKELNIPKDAIVIGRHGGYDTFNLPFTFDVINKITNKRNDIYFLFLNTNNVYMGVGFQCKKLNHDRILFLPKISNLIEKTKFINTCDAMLHARIDGETFGLAIAEFSIRNKPIITWTGCNSPQYDLAHIEMLGDKGIYYNNEKELYEILINFKVQDKNWDAYSEKYNPEMVMKKFKEVFIN